MADAYIGEIRIFGFNFAPRNWAFCNGQTLPIQQNAALFSLIGTFYGGNGTSTFALPNFQSRSAMHQGTGQGLSSYVIGQQSGTAAVTLNSTQIPSHTHQLTGGAVVPPNNTQNVAIPTTSARFALSAPLNAYADTATPPVNFAPQAIGPTGNTLPHENRQPFLSLNFCICLNGVFPSRN